jgi:hypothetical protein
MSREREAATERHITKPLKRLGISLGEETCPKHRESEPPRRRCDDVAVANTRDQAPDQGSAFQNTATHRPGDF